MTWRPIASGQSAWLSIIGIGEDGLKGLNPQARKALDDADLVWGGKRHLVLAQIDNRRRRPWPSPLDAAFDEIKAAVGQKVAVLASGDPFHFGIGSSLARHISMDEIVVFPQPSSFSLAAARLGWPLDQTDCLTIHGRAMERIRPFLQPSAKLMLLSWDETSPEQVADMLHELGLGETQMSVLEALGGPNERVRATTVCRFETTDFNPLNLIALELPSTFPHALPRTGGLDDDLFEHDGQITKQTIRAVTLSALAPRAGELLWDIGLGSGSIAVEWLLAHPKNRAIGVEKVSKRADRARRNATKLGVPGLIVIEGNVLDHIDDLEPPDAVFIGGGGTTYGVIPRALEALRQGGRLVVNAVTLETESLLSDLHSKHGGELRRISVADAEQVGRFRSLRPALPITQWRWIKG